jgi:ATP-dependent Clp protease ATP-binding subunit ClpA
MDYSGFNDEARRVLEDAYLHTEFFRNREVEPEHLFLEVLRRRRGANRGAKYLNDLWIFYGDALGSVVALTFRDDCENPSKRFSDLTVKAVENAREAAREMEHNYLGTEHLVIGLARLTQGDMPEIFRSLEINGEKVEEEVRWLSRSRVEVVA